MASKPDSSSWGARDADSSNRGLGEGRVVHWCEEPGDGISGEDEFAVGGENVHAEDGGAYRSRKDAGEPIAVM